MMREHTTTPLVEGLGFLEGPRWREGLLWFSDFVSRKVHTVDLEGKLTDVVQVEHVPSGLGWLPDGRMLIVSMEDRRLLRLDDGTLALHADLSSHATYHCNDMVVDAQGRAYVGNFGFNYETGDAPVGAKLMRVDPDGSTHVAAEDLLFPNGTVITPDGKTMVVGESFGARLSAFDVADDGTLSNRRVWAQLDGGRIPDGNCLDADGAIWIASPTTKEVVRVLEGGEITDRISTDEREAIACMLGGEDRRTLFVLASTLAREPGSGSISTAAVDVPGAGLP
jgi:sugar lactone lactonase YvrE